LFKLSNFGLIGFATKSAAPGQEQQGANKNAAPQKSAA
jgi:hypothetical protein